MLVLVWKAEKFGTNRFLLASSGFLLRRTHQHFPAFGMLNDHRPFFAYPGLVMAFVCGGILLLEKAKHPATSLL